MRIDLTLAAQGVLGDLQAVERKLTRVATEADKAASKFRTLGKVNLKTINSHLSRTTSLAGDLLKTAGLWATALGANFVMVNSNLEQMEIMMATATGSIQGGQKALNDMLMMSERAPFSINALADSFVKLQTAGIDPMNGSLQILIDSVAAFGGTSEQLRLVTIAVQQMVGKGVISMEELRRQFGEQVPTAIRAMASELGMSIFDMMDLIGKGGLEANKGINALLTGLNKLHSGAAEKRMQSFQGALIRFGNQWKFLMKQIGDSNGLFKGVTNLVNTLADALKRFRESSKGAEILSQISEKINRELQQFIENPEMIVRAVEQIAESIKNVLDPLRAMYEIMVAIGNLWQSGKGWGMLFQGKLNFFEFAQMDAKELHAWLEKESQGIVDIDNKLEELKDKRKSVGEWFAYTKQGTKRKEDELNLISRNIMELERQKSAILSVKSASEALASSIESTRADTPINIYEYGISPLEDFWDETPTEGMIKSYEKYVEKKEKLRFKLSDSIRKITMSEVEYEKWALDQEIADMMKQAGKARDIQDLISEYRTTKMADIEVGQIKGIDKGLEEYFGKIDQFEKDRVSAYENLYSKVNKVSSEMYRTLTKKYADERDAFIEAGIDKETAYSVYMDNIGNLTKKYMSSVDTITDKTKDMSETFDKAFTGWATGFASTLNDAVWDADSSFGDIAKSFGKMLTEMLIQTQIMMPLINSYTQMGGLTGLLGGLFGGNTYAPGTGFTRAVQFLAKGGVKSGPGISAYSNSIVSQPTVFPFAKGIGLMGEAGSEAIMPLTRTSSGDLGVRAEGIGGNGGVVVQINNYSNNEVSQEVSQGPNGEKLISLTIQREIKRAVSSGAMDSTMEQTYGIKRRSIA